MIERNTLPPILSIDEYNSFSDRNVSNIGTVNLLRIVHRRLSVLHDAYIENIDSGNIPDSQMKRCEILRGTIHSVECLIIDLFEF